MSAALKGLKGKILSRLRLQTRRDALWSLLGALMGAALYIALSPITLPGYKLMGMITVQFVPAILVIPLIGAFFGPTAGFLGGFLGSAGADILFAHQIIALGIINLGNGLLGFIAGFPRYRDLTSGRTLGKLLAFTMIGFALLVIAYKFLAQGWQVPS